MRTRTTILLTATLAAALTACSSGTAEPAAPAKAYPSGPAGCHDAIKDQYAPGTLTITGEPTEPPACQGLTSDQVSRIAEKVIAENTR